MRPTEDIVAAAPRPGPNDQGLPPDAVRLTMPAHLSFLATIRAAIRAIVAEIGGLGGPVDDDDLQLAADEAAAVLIQDARPWTEVHLSIAHDDTDIYVRLATRRAQPGRRLVIDDLTELLLDSAVESHEIFAEGRWGYAILQTAQDGAVRSG